jgi:putative sterol carrier protein
MYNVIQVEPGLCRWDVANGGHVWAQAVSCLLTKEGQRMPTIKELFEGMPAAFKPDAAPGVDAVVQFFLTGDQGAEYHVTIADGACKVDEGKHDSPTASLTVDSAVYLDLVSGKLNPQMAFMQGKLKLSGDMGLLMRFQSFFDLSGVS